MLTSIRALAAVAVLTWSATAALAQDKLRIGIIVTLSGPPAVLGGQVRDGFNLAVKTLGGKLGGRDGRSSVVDDELKPDVAVTKVKGLLDRDKVDFVVGPIFSNVLQAIHKPVTDFKAFLISPNAGTSSFAGKQCHPNFFVTSYQNDQMFGVLGKYAQDKGYKRVFLMAPNYQAGKDALAGFKRQFKGEVVDEVYTPLGQLDFSAELTKIAAAKPDALLHVHAGRHGRQPGQAVSAGRARPTSRSCLPSRPTSRRCRRSSDAALGFLAGANWAPNMDNRAEQGVRRRLRGRLQVGSRHLRHAGLRCRPADRQRAQGHRRQD